MGLQTLHSRQDENSDRLFGDVNVPLHRINNDVNAFHVNNVFASSCSAIVNTETTEARRRASV
jgi:hypothetical protein